MSVLLSGDTISVAEYRKRNPRIALYRYALLWTVTLPGEEKRDEPGVSYYADMRRWYAAHPDLDGFFALHSALPTLAAWYKAGEIAVLHAVATPYRERSHFDGQDLLENGTPRPGGAASGWLNRALSLERIAGQSAAG